MKSPRNDFPEVVENRLTQHSEEYCRAVLQYFYNRPIQVATIDELATFIHRQTQPDQDTSQVKIYLHHSTLPRLADAGHIDYDRENNTVRYRGSPS